MALTEDVPTEYIPRSLEREANMADIKLFRLENGKVVELVAECADVERSVQKQMEDHLREYLGVRLLASEYSTGKVHGGRIDTLGIDEEGCPVIIEYKRTQNANVINQGLFYLDWLLDHRADFSALVGAKLGEKVRIDWSSPRLLCIAGSFTKYDQHAIQQISRKVELICYRRFGDSLFLLERVNPTSVMPVVVHDEVSKNEESETRTFEEWLAVSPEVRRRFEALRDFALGLGPGVWMKQRKYAVDFRTGTGREWLNFPLCAGIRQPARKGSFLKEVAVG